MARFRRYQLRKEAVAIVDRGHPWVFREQLSSAASVFRDGDWLRLVDGANRVIGHGIYEAEGAIAIRMLRTGPAAPDPAWFAGRVTAAIERRTILNGRTDAMRLVHGESDGIPAVVVDEFADTIVVASYSAGADALARFTVRQLPGRHAILAVARRRQTGVADSRIIRGTPPEIARFTEDGLTYAVDLAGGQKTGTYLDLRGLRRAIATAPLAGARVLNLFAYSGMLGRAAEAAGAAMITHVDASERALAFAAAHHASDPARHAYVTADVFEWLPALAPVEPYDLVIVDPPAMTSSKAQVPSVLAAYRKLYKAAARHVRPGGAIVAACCTSRVPRAEFHRTVREALPGFTLERELATEVDHPVGFPQADYLKIAWWRRSDPANTPST
ncbi:MAG: class I SAM-dependent methyltransferase [Kofleriaceae bacterium]